MVISNTKTRGMEKIVSEEIVKTDWITKFLTFKPRINKERNQM